MSSPELLGEDEPSVLGAAQTIADDRSARQRRAERRRARSARREVEAEASGLPESGIVQVFEAGARPTMPLGDYIRSIWDRRDLIKEMAHADLRGRHANTVLGRLWSLLDPMFQASIYFFIFAVIRGGRGRPVEFLPVLLVGVFLFGVVGSALGDGAGSIRRSKNLLLSSTFPRALLPIVAIYRRVLTLGPAVFVAGAVQIIVGEAFAWSMLAMPILFVLQVIACLGVALLAATATVFFRDASNFLGYVNRVMLFASPVIFPAGLLPDNIRNVVRWHPLYAPFEGYQIAMSGSVPPLWNFLVSAGWAALLLVAGVRVFRRREREFAAHL